MVAPELATVVAVLLTALASLVSAGRRPLPASHPIAIALGQFSPPYTGSINLAKIAINRIGGIKGRALRNSPFSNSVRGLRIAVRSSRGLGSASG